MRVEGDPTAGVTSAHVFVLGSHSQVSFSAVPVASLPPKTTSLLLAQSHVTPAWLRAGGEPTAPSAVIITQGVPSNCQRSFMATPPLVPLFPPKTYM